MWDRRCQLAKELVYNKSMPDQEYIVEVFSPDFKPLAEVGPVGYAEAQAIYKENRAKGLLASITEKELLELVRAY